MPRNAVVLDLEATVAGPRAGGREKAVPERSEQRRHEDQRHRDPPKALGMPVTPLKTFVLVDLDVAVPGDRGHRVPPRVSFDPTGSTAASLPLWKRYLCP